MTQLPPTLASIAQHLRNHHGFSLRDAYSQPQVRLLADHDQLHRIVHVDHEHGVPEPEPVEDEPEAEDYIEAGGITFVHVRDGDGYGDDHYLTLPGVCDDEEVTDALDDIFEEDALLVIEHVERVELCPAL